MSLHVIYPKRNINADMMRSTQMLSLLAEPAKIMNSPITDMVSTVEHAKIMNNPITDMVSTVEHAKI